MIGRGLVEGNTQELPQRKAVRTPPGDAALAIQVLEVADQEHAEVHTRRNAGLAPLLLLGVILLAAPLDPIVEMGLRQQLIQLLIKRVAGRLGQLRRRNKQCFLPLLAPSHRHEISLPASMKYRRHVQIVTRWSSQILQQPARIMVMPFNLPIVAEPTAPSVPPPNRPMRAADVRRHFG